MGFASVLTLIFITLKLWHLINWSWWLVLLPAYAGLLVFGVITLIPIVLLVIGAIGGFFITLFSRE